MPVTKQHRVLHVPSWRNHIQDWMDVRESHSCALEQGDLSCQFPCPFTFVIFSMKLSLPVAICACGVFAAIVVESRHQMDPDTILGLGEPCHHGGLEKREVGGKASKQCDKILDQIGDICKKYFSDSDDGGDDDGEGWVFKYL